MAACALLALRPLDGQAAHASVRLAKPPGSRKTPPKTLDEARDVTGLLQARVVLSNTSFRH
jgi:hypothetical protein|tara:strand:+ start:237 stop:419 length:183 start_codon:yes stop_codon:yes gene_type:complete